MRLVSVRSLQLADVMDFFACVFRRAPQRKHTSANKNRFCNGSKAPYWPCRSMILSMNSLPVFFRACLSPLLAHLYEKVGEPLQGVLVHGVDHVKVSHAEVHDGPSVGHRSIPLASLVDLLLRHFGFRHLHTWRMRYVKWMNNTSEAVPKATTTKQSKMKEEHERRKRNQDEKEASSRGLDKRPYLVRDLGRGLLGRGERFDQLVVVEDVALGVTQQEQDAVLDFLQLLLHLGICHHCKCG